MYGYVYLTTNLVNQKKYIGQHKSSKFDPKYKGSGKILWEAINKYGWDNFSIEILEWCDSREQLNEVEIAWISKTNAVTSSEYYNMAGGGDGWGSQWVNPEFRKFIIDFLHNQVISDETKQKLSDSGKRYYAEHPEDRIKISKQMKDLQKDGGFMKGKHHSEKTKARMSETRKGKPHIIKHLDEFRKTCSERHADMSNENNPMYGKKHSKESKQKMSRSHQLNNNIGYIWFNNGSIELLTNDEIRIQNLLDQGFTKGRLKHKRRKRKSSTTIESIGNEKDITE